MMANDIVLFSYPNRAGGNLTYSSPLGCWTAGLPLSYLAEDALSQVARSLTSQKNSTLFYATATSAIGVSVAALLNHNMGVTGQWRLRGFTADPRPYTDVVFGADGSVPSGVTLSRAGTAYYFNKSGVLTSAGTNVSRPHWENGVYQGWLIEPGITNFAIQNRSYNNWTSSSGSSTVSSSTGIDGTAQNVRVTATGATARRSVVGSGIGTANRVFSVYMRRITGTGAVRLTADNFGTTTDISGTLTTSWKRFFITSSSATTNVGFQIDTNGDAIEVDFAQHEVQALAKPTSPVPTTASTATRAGDNLQVALSGINWPLSLAIKCTPKLGAGTMFYMGSGGPNSARMSAGGGIAGNVTVVSSSSTQVNMTTTAVADEAAYRFAFAMNTNDCRAYQNNASAGTPDTVCTLPAAAPTTCAFGSSVLGAADTCMGVEYIRIYSTVQVNADLQELSDEGEIVSGYDSGLTDAWNADWVTNSTGEKRVGVRGNAPKFIGSTQTYQYWRVDMVDESLSYAQLGGVHFGPDWQPQANMLLGAGIGYRDRDLKQEMDSGSIRGTRRPSPRVAPFVLKNLSDTVAMEEVLEMQRQMGTLDAFLFAWKPNDTRQLPRRCFPARLERLDVLNIPESTQLWANAFNVEEVI